MDLANVENKIEKHDLYQRIGLNREIFSGASLLIQKEFSRIRDSVLEVPDNFDIGLETSDSELFLVMKDNA